MKADISEEYGSEYLFGIIVGCGFRLHQENVRPFYTIFLVVTEYQGPCTFVVLITLWCSIVAIIYPWQPQFAVSPYYFSDKLTSLICDADGMSLELPTQGKVASSHLLRFFLFCFVYLCLFIIFRSESWHILTHFSLTHSIAILIALPHWYSIYSIQFCRLFTL